MIRRWIWAFGLGLASLAGAQQKAFDVASVKENHSQNPPSSNFPLGPGNAYSPNGGYFNATGYPLLSYILFAYKVMGNNVTALQQQVPAWALTDRYDIQARVQGNPTKDEMRELVKTLLAERFQLVMRNETREMPVAALVLVKEGKLGPQLRQHPPDEPCPLDAPGGQLTPDGRFPMLCGGLVGMPASEPGRLHFGGRNVTIEFIANTLTPGTASGRTMVDRTGLTGKFDFSLEFTQEVRGAAPREADSLTEQQGPTLEEALRAQLGLKLESQKGPVSVLVVEHLERPSGN